MVAERALNTSVNILSRYTWTNQANCDLVVKFAVFIMNASESETSSYLPRELVFGRMPIFPVDLALSYDGLEEILDRSQYAEMVSEWLEKARKIAREKSNRTHDKEAPRCNAKRSRHKISLREI